MRSSSSTDAATASRAKGFFARLSKIGVREWLDFGIAILELALTRLKLGKVLVPEGIGSDISHSLDQQALERAERVRIAIARASSRVPWRSDCLVQAMAAQHWLGRHGIQTDLTIGVRKEKSGMLDAHAWLKCGAVMVTGGDGLEYVSLVPSMRRRAPHRRP